MDGADTAVARGGAAAISLDQAPATDPGAWFTAAPMRGACVTMEQLTMADADGLFDAVADIEVFRYAIVQQPADRTAMAAIVKAALDARDRGERVPWVVRDTTSDEIIGTTSYHDIAVRDRRLAIGHTMFARRRWATGVNAESKLLMLRRAFEELGAVRVEWYADPRNVRSLRAIQRLGARPEGLLRRHRRRADGTWRDSIVFAMLDDEWPVAQRRLLARLGSRAAP